MPLLLRTFLKVTGAAALVLPAILRASHSKTGVKIMSNNCCSGKVALCGTLTPIEDVAGTVKDPEKAAIIMRASSGSIDATAGLLAALYSGAITTDVTRSSSNNKGKR